MSGIFQKGRYGKYIHYLLTSVDFVVINIAFAVTAWLQPSLVEERSRTVWLLANFCYLPIAYWLNANHRNRTIQMDHVIANSLKAAVAEVMVFVAVVHFVDINNIAWTAYTLFAALLTAGFPIWGIAWRLALKAYRRHGGNYASVVIIGATSTGMRLLEEMKTDYGFGYKVVGVFDDDPLSDVPDGLFRGDISALERFIADGNKVDEIFYAIPGDDENRMKRVVKIADDNVIRFYYVPLINSYFNRVFQLTAIGSMPVMSASNNPLNSIANKIIKRGFDIAVSGTLLLLSPIVVLPVALAIKLSSPGPVFFRQRRTGYLGHEFVCYKFRTMKVNTESDSRQATPDDPRTTRVGTFLRHTSIDELPQIWNVFIGDMSLVGPRPHMLSHTEHYARIIDKYMVRHFVKPGITGWAQVNGYRGATTELWQMDKRVKYDVWYIEHWSALLDLKIILRTIYNAIAGEPNAF